MKNSDPEQRSRQFTAAVSAMVGIAPQDELEGMLAAQLVAANAAAMECYRRAMIDERTFEGRKENLAQGSVDVNRREAERISDLVLGERQVATSPCASPTAFMRSTHSQKR